MDARAWMVRLALGVGLAGGSRCLRGADADGCPRPPTRRRRRRRSCPDGRAEDPAGVRRIGLDAAPTTATGRARSMPPRRPRSRCWTRCRTRRRSACGSTAARCRAGRSAPACKDSKPRAADRAAWTATARRPRSRSARSRRAGGRRSPTRSRRRRRTSATAARARSCSSPTARTPASRPRRAASRSEVSKGGVVMRIQAIGFNVDPEARARARVHRQRGRRRLPRRHRRGVACARSCGSLSTRALRQYIARKGKPIKGGPSARQATLITPGRYIDKLLPDSERWYAIELARGETLKASASFIPPDRDVGDRPARARRWTSSRPSFDVPDIQNSSAGNGTPFARRGYVDGLGVVSRPIGVGEQADADAPFSKPGRYYLKLALEDSTRQGALQRDRRQAVHAELSVEVLGRRAASREAAEAGEATPQAVDTPDEPPSPAVLTRRRRRAGRPRASPARRADLLWRRTRVRALVLAVARRCSRCRPRVAQPSRASRSSAAARSTPRRCSSPAATPTPSRPARPSTGRSSSPRARCCASRATVDTSRDRDRLLRQRLPRRAWTTSTTTSTSSRPLREPLSDEYDWRERVGRARGRRLARARRPARR